MIATYTLKQRVLNLLHDHPGRTVVVGLDASHFDAVCAETGRAFAQYRADGVVTAIKVEGVTVRRAEIIPPTNRR